MGVQVPPMRKCKNARVQVRIKLVDGGSYNGQWLFCTLFIICIVYIGIQTDYYEPAKYCDAVETHSYSWYIFVCHPVV